MSGSRILFVEDDPEQRSVLAELLRREGYRVRESPNAEDALRVLEDEQVDLLIADYQLGGATGTWLARVASRSLQPAPRVLLMTGHDRLADAYGLKVLRKPVEASQFLKEVEQSLTVPEESFEAVRPTQRIAFILYVNQSLRSRRTLKALQKMFDECEPGQVALTVVDLSGDVARAEEHRITVTPTLLKTFPVPRLWIAGEVQRSGVLERLLEQAGVEARK